MKIFFVSGLSIGLLLLGLSLFAEQLGMDNDAGWGTGRLLVLKAGIAISAVSIICIVFEKKLSGLWIRLANAAKRFQKISYPVRMGIFLVPAVLIVAGAYTWFSLPALQDGGFIHYSLLAQAFHKGQLHLIEAPPPELLALDDPYNYVLRKEKGIENFPFDASLYDSKLYFYWGPAPSLLLSLLSEGTITRIRDVHLVFAFTCGLFLYSLLLGYSIWKKYNATLPAWLFGFSLLAIGLSTPTAQILREARVYEAAISGCQFFFIGGVYWVYSAFEDETPSRGKILLAGIHWALALGTRITIAPVILFTTVMMLSRLPRQNRWQALTLAAFLCAPLAIATAGLAWYNWARFGSVLEFGLTYQLANVNYSVFHDSFSTGYIRENLYNYFFHPLEFRSRFPYLQPIENFFTNEHLAGLIYVSPYILFAAMFPLRFLTGLQRPNATGNWFTLLLAGSTLLAALVVLSFYFPTARYGGDFMPALLLLATNGVGEGFLVFGRNKTSRGIYILLVVLAAFASVLISSLVAIEPYRVKGIVHFLRGMRKLFGL